MRLICKKYRWNDSSLSGDDINFFSNTTRVLESTIDLKYYLIKDTLSEFETEFESINEVTNGLEIRMSNVSFQCKNEILGRTSLQDFFEVYEKDNLIKFRFEYYNDDNDLLFSGLIYKDGVEFANRTNDILDIISVSEEKEFIDYFSKQELDYPQSWNWLRAVTLFGLITGNSALQDLPFFRLIDLLQANLPNVTIGGIPSTHYYVAKVPYTYSPFSANYSFAEMTSLMHIRTGFDCFILDGWKVYDYFSAMFQAKGWVWYFSKGSLYIKGRGQTGLSTTTIDYQTEVLSHSVSSDILEKQVDNVTIYNGAYFDNSSVNGALRFTDTGGTRRYLGGAIRLIHTAQSHSNKTRPFVRLEYSVPSSDTHWYRFVQNFLDYSVIQEENERESYRKRIRLNGSTLLTYSETINAYNVQRTLMIDPGANSTNNSGGVDMNNARAGDPPYYGNGNFFYAANSHTDSHLYYNGNPASSLIRFDTASEKFYSYEVDCEKEEFLNNFKKFIQSANPILFDMEVKKEITDPFQNILITNYPYDNSVNNKTFSIQKLSYNDLTKITKLTLQML